MREKTVLPEMSTFSPYADVEQAMGKHMLEAVAFMNTTEVHDLGTAARFADALVDLRNLEAAREFMRFDSLLESRAIREALRRGRRVVNEAVLEDGRTYFQVACHNVADRRYPSSLTDKALVLHELDVPPYRLSAGKFAMQHGAGRVNRRGIALPEFIPLSQTERRAKNALAIRYGMGHTENVFGGVALALEYFTKAVSTDPQEVMRDPHQMLLVHEMQGVVLQAMTRGNMVTAYAGSGTYQQAKNMASDLRGLGQRPPSTAEVFFKEALPHALGGLVARTVTQVYEGAYTAVQGLLPAHWQDASRNSPTEPQE